MNARILLLPLVILSGFSGALALIGVSFLTEKLSAYFIPYLIVIFGVFVYMREQEKFVFSFRHFFITLFSIMMIMSLLIYAHISFIQENNFFELPVMVHVWRIVLIAAGAISTAFFLSLLRKKNTRKVIEKNFS